MDETVTTESRVRTRTRMAILEAAVVVLGENASASLGDVAAEAGVSRSTLQRYFGERSELVQALAQFAWDRVEEVKQRALAAGGSPVETLLALFGEFFDLGDLIMLAFTFTGEEGDEDPDRELLDLVERGQQDGSIDPALPADWVELLMWSTLYAAWMRTKTGKAVLRHEVLEVSMRSFRKVISV